MKVFLYITAAVCGYLVAGVNPAIMMSKMIYHRDIRECGSKNPGFTNFKRTFGNKWAWWVLVLDLSKAAIVTGVFGGLFQRYMEGFSLGAAYTGVFAMLGHAYPIAYEFKGGKGFLVCLSTMWVIDWRVGLIATLLMIVLLLTTKYMSLSTVSAMLTCPVMLVVLKASLPVILLALVCVVFMAWRHKENFKRLLQGTESKFSFGGKSSKE